MDYLRERIPGEITDYQFVMDALKDYSKPRDKLTRLLRDEDLIRVKKGLYVFGPRWRRGLIQTEALANAIYGPSYVSLEWALAHYGFIPEAVHEVTSVTTGRNKVFETPLYRFSYRHLPLKAYAIGFECRAEGYLIATPEKAVADVIARFTDLETMDDLLEALTEDLRIYEEDIAGLKIGLLTKIARAYSHNAVSLLPNLVRSLR